MSTQSERGFREPDPVAVAGWAEVDRLSAENRDLQRRIERTVEYVRTIRPLIRGEEAQGVLTAIMKGLSTPAVSSLRGDDQ